MRMFFVCAKPLATFLILIGWNGGEISLENMNLPPKPLPCFLTLIGCCFGSYTAFASGPCVLCALLYSYHALADHIGCINCWRAHVNSYFVVSDLVCCALLAFHCCWFAIWILYSRTMFWLVFRVAPGCLLSCLENVIQCWLTGACCTLVYILEFPRALVSCSCCLLLHPCILIMHWLVTWAASVLVEPMLILIIVVSDLVCCVLLAFHCCCLPYGFCIQKRCFGLFFGWHLGVCSLA